MYILYNQDGSVKAVNLADFIQKGNDNVNSIFLAIEGRSNDSWSASVCFELPSGEKTFATPISKSEEIKTKLYNGWEVKIGSAITIYEGLVNFSVSALNLQNQVLFTYRNKLTINPSIITPNVTTITYEQYENLLEYINSEFQNNINFQTNVAIIRGPIININGWVLSNYESEEKVIEGYPCYKITYGGENLDEEKARNYMEYMSGSRFLPVYNYYKPQNSYFINSNGEILKPQFDETNGLLLYKITNPFATH